MAIEKIAGSPEQTAASVAASALHQEIRSAEASGWVLVPTEPTDEMLVDGSLSVIRGTAPGGAWRAMISAAPSLFGG